MKQSFYYKIIFLSLFILNIIGTLNAQNNVPIFGKQNYLNGYQSSLNGESLFYFSIYPDFAKEALLTRCTSGEMAIEWLSDTIPADYKGEYVYFMWVAAHSSGTSKGSRNFDLFVNDQKNLTFTTKAKEYPDYWAFVGKDSTKLVFDYQVLDRANDSHGICYLRIKMKNELKGKALKFKIVGQKQESSDWFMTFKYAFHENIEFEIWPFVTKNGKQVLSLNVMHFGTDVSLSLKIGNLPAKSFPLNYGFNSIEQEIDTVLNPTKLVVSARVGKSVFNFNDLQSPAIYREINLIHHSHTDIGYSDYQENVLKIHVNNIRNAIAMIEKTKDFPQGSKFIWNVEMLWAVENFLNEANPVEKAKFLDYVKNGSIVLNGFYINALTGLCQPEEMDWLLEYGDSIKKTYQLPINTVMFSDIPGLNWSIVFKLSNHGIRYFCNGPNYSGNGNPDHGDRIGSTLLKFGNKPFWWVSETGKDSILFFTGSHGYSGFHSLSVGIVQSRGPKMLKEFVNELDASNYPYEMVLLNYNIVSDNGPIDSSLSSFVKNWNEKYASPKLVINSSSAFLTAFDKKYGSSLPSLHGDFNPYWEDGAYSTTAESIKNRMLAQKLIQLEALAKQENRPINPTLLYLAHRNSIMFTEHTWGSWNSVSDPDNEFTTKQWAYKKRFVDSAEFYINLIARKQISESPYFNSYNVINTMNCVSTQFVETSMLPRQKFNVLQDEINNELVEIQKLKNGNIVFIAKEIPANRFKDYFPIQVKKPKVSDFIDRLNIKITNNLGVSSITFNGISFINSSVFNSMAQLVYVEGMNPKDFTQAKLDSFVLEENGAFLRRYHLYYSLKSFQSVEYIIDHYSDSKVLKISIIVHKMAVREKEAVHIALPFAIANPIIHYGIGDTCINPATGLLPAANKEFFSVQKWMDVSNSEMGVTISCPQLALFEVGSMIDETRLSNGFKPWKESYSPSSTIFLYAMNNYWHTNYKADQSGKMQFDVYLKFHDKFNLESARKFGESIQARFLVRPAVRIIN